MTINANEKLSEIMWKGLQVDALLRGIQSLDNDGVNADSCTMETLAGIARPFISEIRNLADELSCEIPTRPIAIRQGPK